MPKPASIGKSKRTIPIKDTPGPCSYDVKYSASAKSLKSPVVKIGTTKRVEIFVGREDEPGPALYASTDNLKKNAGPSFGLKSAETRIESPGP